jgi:hypothetical protein
MRAVLTVVWHWLLSISNELGKPAPNSPANISTPFLLRHRQARGRYRGFSPSLGVRTVSLHGKSDKRKISSITSKWFINSDPEAREWRKEDKKLVIQSSQNKLTECETASRYPSISTKPKTCPARLSPVWARSGLWLTHEGPKL